MNPKSEVSAALCAALLAGGLAPAAWADRSVSPVSGAHTHLAVAAVNNAIAPVLNGSDIPADLSPELTLENVNPGTIAVDPKVVAFLERAGEIKGPSSPEAQVAGSQNNLGTAQNADGSRLLAQLSHFLKNIEAADIRRMPLEDMDRIAKLIWDGQRTAGSNLVPAVAAGEAAADAVHKTAALLPAKPAGAVKSFLKSLIPRPSYDTTRDVDKLKFGFRSGIHIAAWPILSLIGAEKLGYKPHPNYESPMKEPEDLEEAVTMMIFGSFAAPLLEEVIFRTFAYGLSRWALSQFISKNASVWIAGALNAVVFTVIHETSDPLYIAGRLFGSALLVYAYEKGGLQASTVAHATLNFFIFFPALILASSLGYSTGMSYLYMTGLYAAVLVLAWLHDRYIRKIN